MRNIEASGSKRYAGTEQESERSREGRQQGQGGEEGGRETVSDEGVRRGGTVEQRRGWDLGAVLGSAAPSGRGLRPHQDSTIRASTASSPKQAHAHAHRQHHQAVAEQQAIVIVQHLRS